MDRFSELPRYSAPEGDEMKKPVKCCSLNKKYNFVQLIPAY